MGLFDQAQPFLLYLRSLHTTHLAEYRKVESFVKRLEARLPEGAAVCQLPATVFLNDEGRERMGTYDHFKPCLVAGARLRWSYPAFTNQQFQWERALTRQTMPDRLGQLFLDGFSAVLVDTAGYERRGEAPLRSIAAVLGPDARLAENARYVAFDLRGLAAHPELLRQAERSRVPWSALTPRLARCAGRLPIQVDQIGRTRPSPGRPLAASTHHEIAVAGWAILPEARQCPRVEMAVDDDVFLAYEGFARLDVARFFNEPRFAECGFRAIIPAGSLGPGRRDLRVRAIAADRSCYFESDPYPLDCR